MTDLGFAVVGGANGIGGGGESTVIMSGLQEYYQRCTYFDPVVS